MDEHVGVIKAFADDRCDEVAVVQVGADEQEQFTTWAEKELLPALRSL